MSEVPAANGAKQNSGHPNTARFLVVVLLLGAIPFGIKYYIQASDFVTTDNAFIEGDVVRVSPQVPGRLVKVCVKENERINKEDLIAEIDPRPYQAKLNYDRAAVKTAESKKRSAEIALELTKATTEALLRQAEADVEAARAARERYVAGVAAAEAEKVRASADLRRYDNLAADNAASHQQKDLAVSMSNIAEAKLAEARKAVTAADAQITASMARLEAAKTAPQQVAESASQIEQRAADIEQAKTAIEASDLNVAYTKIVAPAAGRITRKSMQEGEYVQPGQALTALVPDDIWIVANFKETQITHVKPGQAVEVRIDAHPERALRAHVDSLQAGTGARFSLLPPENATGNYVKVVQRVPVKIRFDEPIPDGWHVAPGMSVVPRVKVKVK